LAQDAEKHEVYTRVGIDYRDWRIESYLQAL